MNRRALQAPIRAFPIPRLRTKEAPPGFWQFTCDAFGAGRSPCPAGPS